MAIKLKNFSHAWYIKFLAYVMIAVIAGGVLLLVGNKGENIDFSNLTVGNYEEAYEVRNYFMEYGNAAMVVASIEPGMLDINNKEYWNFETVDAEGNTTVQGSEPDTNVSDTSDLATEPGQEQAEITEQSNSIAMQEDAIEYGEQLVETVEGQIGKEYDTRVYLTIPIENQEIAEKVKEEIRNFYYVWWEKDGRCHLSITHDGEGELFYNSVDDVGPSKEIDLSYSNFLKEHPQLEKTVLSGVLRSIEYDYDRAKGVLEKGVVNQGLVYDIADVDSSELKEKYTALSLYTRMEENYITNSSVSKLIGNYIGGYYSNSYNMNGKVCYIGMSEEYYQERNSQWIEESRRAVNILDAILLGVLGVLVLFFYLAAVTGRRLEEEGVHLYPVDRIWSEFQWSAGAALTAGIIGILIEVVFASRQYLFGYYAAMVGLIVVMGLTLLMLLLSQIRLLKAGKWLDSFICIRLIKKCFNWIKKWTKWIVTEIFNGLKSNKITRTAYILAIVLPLLCATWIGVPIVIAFLCFLIYHYLEDFLSICKGAEEIRNGAIHYKIKIKNEDGILGKLAEDINELSEGLKAAVSNELRSERLKAELISNVSHDLKTPLTSIVTYVDLLKQEEVENETAKDYIEVIDRKAKRLTVLTNDLFEAAKASSGAMPVNIETVDLNALVRQALGEFDEKLEQAKFNVRLTLPDTPSYIKADGRLTWRVIDNLLNNVVKYGQTGSRVYIEVREYENTFGFIMKNISAYELNIPSDELMERFKRGDESRNSEGSGLGLNIANSLIDLQHGSFKISIDGDLFKAEFELPKSV